MERRGRRGGGKEEGSEALPREVGKRCMGRTRGEGEKEGREALPREAGRKEGAERHETLPRETVNTE